MAREVNRDMVGIRPLLLGAPLSTKENDPRPMLCVDSHVEGVRQLIQKVYGERQPLEVVRVLDELQYVVDLPTTEYNGASCKRALVLMAMHLEREVADYFDSQEGMVYQGEPSVARDIKERVVPFLLPMYVSDMCQDPERFVAMTTVLATMWAGETMGSFGAPLARDVG